MDTKPHSLGRVYLVGAGPSDAGLLTVKGKQVLERAQVVVYDALVGSAILAMMPEQAEKINVGKRAGRHSASQGQISQLLVEKALEGRLVVRLKGGDPLLFGRGGEELELLEANHIPFEIVPGVTSALAAAAYAGIPVTHREAASSVHLVTGHKKQDRPLEIDFEALVRAGGTYVFFMGMAALADIADGFLKAGMDENTPAAVVSQGTGAGQRKVIATLRGLVQEVARQQLATPAVIIIGETAALGNRFGWYEKLPLSHCRILVTRPPSRSRELVDSLRSLGAEVVETPTVQTKRIGCSQPFLEEMARIGDYAYLGFTSPAGVEYFFELLEELELDVRCIGSIKLAAIGSATAKALKKRGLRVDLMPSCYNSTALGRLLNESVPQNGRVLLLRSKAGSKELVDEIQKGRQIPVTDLAIYDTVYYKSSAVEIQPLIENGPPAVVMFTSASTVRGFVQAAPGLDASKVRAVCIGQATAAEASRYGMQVWVAKKESVPDMVAAVLQMQKEQEGK